MQAGVCKEAIYTQTAPGNTPAEIEEHPEPHTGHRKMVAYFDLGDAGPNMFDESSHGTHTGGSIDGDKRPYGTSHSLPTAWRRPRSTSTRTSPRRAVVSAVSRRRVQHVPPGLPAPESGRRPDDLDTGRLLEYLPNEDARTHNNSWGSITGVVDDGTAMRFDRFVWDHEDMVIVVSAGNGGPGASTIFDASIAKNDMSSGASANGRQPMVSIDSMAASRRTARPSTAASAPTVRPPVRSSSRPRAAPWTTSTPLRARRCPAPILTGLSTLVRQYFYDGYGPAGGKGSRAARHTSRVATTRVRRS